jgi:hypothetical protein
MSKISKKLTNVLIVEGKNEEVLNFIERVRRASIKVLSVRCPKDTAEITTSFVESNWRLSNLDLKNRVFYGKQKSGKVILAFADDEIEFLLINIVEAMSLNATYKYFVENNDSSVIMTEVYENGELVSDEQVSNKFKASKYSVAKCFA